MGPKTLLFGSLDPRDRRLGHFGAQLPVWGGRGCPGRRPPEASPRGARGSSLYGWEGLGFRL